MTNTNDRYLTARARQLLRDEKGTVAHLGAAPFGSHTSGPMRRDYQITRFMRLAARNAPRSAGAPRA